MTEEEAKQLRQENADLKEAVAQKDQRIEELEGLLMSAVLRIEELERRLVKDSHTSHKPPSSDGLRHKGLPRKKSEKPSGGQRGHQGHAMLQAAVPDHVLIHRPTHCERCHCELSEVVGQV